SDIFSTTSGLESTNIIRVGESVGSIFAVETQGVNPANGQRVFIKNVYDANGNITGTVPVQYSHVVPAGQSRWTTLDGMPASAAALVADGKVYGPAIPKWF